MTKSMMAYSITGALAALLLAPSASAQTTDAPAQDDQAEGTSSPVTPASTQARATPSSAPGEDIVVTAQKRAQVLIDVPQSVSVVGGDTLQRNQAYSFQDYAKLVPGLQLAQSNPGEARIVLRGINTGGVAATVATYIDETPFGSSSGQVNSAILAGEFDTFDVARVEVLRGPQGTLYGASSLGGVLKYVTAAPSTDKVEARGRASLESTKGGDLSYMGSAVVNLPLGDTFAVRASGFYRDYGGYIDSVGNGGSDVQKNINGSKSYGGRISALFKPSDAFQLRLTAILQNLDSDAGTVVESDPLTLRTLYGRNTQSQYVPEYTNIAYRVYNATADVDLGFATLTSSTSYSTLKQSLRDDLTVNYGTQLGLYDDATGAAADLGLVQHTDTKRFTQEVRLSSPASDTFEWLIGGYYDHEKGAIIQRLDVYEPGTFTIFTGVPQLFDGANPSRYEEFAGFANGTVHFGPMFDLTLGGRYSHNDQDASQSGTGLLAPDALSSASKENVFTWSVAPKFKFSRTGAIYARVAKGFRPGGPNIVPPNAPSSLSTYDSDSLISYEVGLKAETADRSFAIDIAAFHIDWRDIQLFAQVNDFGINANGGKAKSDGVEFTATMRPTRGFVVSLNGAYTDAKLKEDTDLAIVGGRNGDQLPYTPKYAVSANADYDWQIGSATPYLGASLRFLSDQSGPYSPTFVAATGRQFRIPSYGVVDLRAGVDFGRFSVEAYAKNLTNSVGKTSVSGEGNYPFGAVGTGIIRPRVIGVTLGAGF
ncbi:Outer membrane receptor proteins, mostly Fe transport [Sphingomonas gellani]|uniref:Outer membrane receptor proteins, mostly Fe transport n=1 Tax=Sphingomonas gellani TaxID=1166340 RepID=A0A1H8APZ9_9SPHN|nr:TonB-dependent receptor [Sphingomonas gellani]SEM71597.1 Outer membrane receptor proteins, mostly Fe transport [Sphingomonas gellani]